MFRSCNKNTGTMEEGWIVIFTTDKPYQAEMAKKMLESNGIESVVVNKKDSIYQSFGEAELYVKEENAELAKDSLKKLQIE